MTSTVARAARLTEVHPTMIESLYPLERGSSDNAQKLLACANIVCRKHSSPVRSSGAVDTTWGIRYTRGVNLRRTTYARQAADNTKKEAKRNRRSMHLSGVADGVA